MQHLHAPPTTPIIPSSGSSGLLRNDTLVDSIRIESDEAYASSAIIIVRVPVQPLLIGNLFFDRGIALQSSPVTTDESHHHHYHHRREQ
jgi:hypothetical protein